MRYSIEPRDKIYVNCYEFLSFATNIGALSNKYSQKRLDSAKKSTTDAIETGSKKKQSKAIRRHFVQKQMMRMNKRKTYISR